VSTMTERPTEAEARRALELLGSGRVRIRHADETIVDAEVRSASSDLTYHVTGSAAFWVCQCPANRLGSRRCKHILAVQSVWAPGP
jgi:uncharacterized Zn finger protein